MIRSTITKFKVSLISRRALKSSSSNSSDKSGHPDVYRTPKYPDTDISDLHNAFMYNSQKEKPLQIFKAQLLEHPCKGDKVQDDLFQVKEVNPKILENIPKSSEGFENFTLKQDESENQPVSQTQCTNDFYKNHKFGSSPEADKQIAFDEIAKRCLDAPFHEIDDRLLKELKNVKIPPRNDSSSSEASNTIEQPIFETEIDSKIREYSKEPVNAQNDSVNRLHKENLSQIVSLQTHTEKEDRREKCRRLIAEAFGEPGYNDNDDIVKRVNKVSKEELLQMTNVENEDVKLLRQIENIDDSSLEETENKNDVDSSNIRSKILEKCERSAILQCEKKDEFGKEQKSLNFDTGTFVTNIEEKCLENSNNKINPTLMKEINKFGLVSESGGEKLLNTSISNSNGKKGSNSQDKNNVVVENCNLNLINNHENNLETLVNRQDKYKKCLPPPFFEGPQMFFSESNKITEAPVLSNNFEDVPESKQYILYLEHKQPIDQTYYLQPVTHSSYQVNKSLIEHNDKETKKIDNTTLSMFEKRQELEESVTASEQVCSEYVSCSPPLTEPITQISETKHITNDVSQTTLDNLMKTAVVHPSIQQEEILSRTEPLPNPESIPVSGVNSDAISLNEMLRRVRERHKFEFCKQFTMNMKEIDPIVGTCVKGAPPCPPPPPKCPPPCPPPPPPCPPPPPPCPKPCKKPCPSPCPSPCLPPKEKPCKCTSNSCRDIITMILNATSIWKTYSLCLPLIYRISSTSPKIPDSRAKLTEEVENKLYNLGNLFLTAHYNKIYNLQSENFQEVTENDSSLVKARDFDPWIPIPCWPIPVKVEKRPLQTPSQGCKLLPPPPPSQPCKEKHCAEFPKRSFSLVNLFI